MHEAIPAAGHDAVLCAGLPGNAGDFPGVVRMGRNRGTCHLACHVKHDHLLFWDKEQILSAAAAVLLEKEEVGTLLAVDDVAKYFAVVEKARTTSFSPPLCVYWRSSG